MLKIRSKLTASASFFGAAVAALIAVSAHPDKAVAFDGGDCGGYSGTPVCSEEEEITKYCTDGVSTWACGWKTTYTYYAPVGNG